MLEESICRPLTGIQNYKPFFKYCKEDPEVENIYLKSIEDHVRLKDPERHKAKLLELLEKEEVDYETRMIKTSSKNEIDN